MARKKVVERGPMYRALEESYIDDVLVPPGGEVEYFGLPGSKLEPINDEAEEVVKQVDAIEKAYNQGKLNADQRRSALRSLSDELNEVDPKRAPRANFDEPLSDAERKVLEKHARAAFEASEKKREDDTNITGVKLQGQNVETEASLQGATPVTDKGSSKK